MIPGSDANALSANLPGSCDRAFNLFFIHSLALPFLSLVVVLCGVGVDVLGPPSRASIRTPIAIPTADNMDSILLEKVSCLGFAGKTIACFTSYLTNRSFIVNVGKESSSPGKLSCGVPKARY